jgi:hypothetical protein
MTKPKPTVTLSPEDWQRLLQIAAFTYTPQDERILNAIKEAAQ